jgi:hypothetical protein
MGKHGCAPEYREKWVEGCPPEVNINALKGGQKALGKVIKVLESMK